LDFKELKIKANTEEFTVKNQSFIWSDRGSGTLTFQISWSFLE
jgi:hypothetical protein